MLSCRPEGIWDLKDGIRHTSNVNVGELDCYIIVMSFRGIVNSSESYLTGSYLTLSAVSAGTLLSRIFNVRGNFIVAFFGCLLYTRQPSEVHPARLEILHFRYIGFD
jgi:hypothetical protein